MAKRQATPVRYLHLETSSYTDVTREADPEDSWGADDTSTTWSAEGITLAEIDGQYALPADFPVEVGDVVYVVFAVYSTGDTFHHADGAYLEVLSFNKNREVAYRNRDSAQGRRAADDKYNMTIEFDSGGKVQRHCPWDGYFESLDYVSVESFTVQERSKRW